MIPEPGLYVGTVRHRRFAPRPHAFEYPLFMAFIDIDRVREMMAASRLTSYNRWNWAAFDERDHIGDPGRPLRDRLRESAARAAERLPDGPIRLLTNLRYAGYVFNPISLYYCYDHDGRLQRVLADVSNTYGGRHGYWLNPIGETRRRFRAEAGKALHVSPFMDYDVDYEFVLTPPADSLVAHLNVTRRDAAKPVAGRLFDATLTLKHRPWTPRAIRATLIQFPWVTAKVIAAIYWEALRLRLKGLEVRPFPREEHDATAP